MEPKLDLERLQTPENACNGQEKRGFFFPPLKKPVETYRRYLAHPVAFLGDLRRSAVRQLAHGEISPLIVRPFKKAALPREKTSN